MEPEEVVAAAVVMEVAAVVAALDLHRQSVVAEGAELARTAPKLLPLRKKQDDENYGGGGIFPLLSVAL